jgi:maltose O-acetyltransferase
VNYLKELIYRIRGEYTTEKLIKMGMRVGENFTRLNDVILDPAHCWLIEIGNNVTMAPRVHVLCHDASTKQFIGYTKIGGVKVGNNVFVGINATVVGNIRIGNDVLIAPNSYVNTDIPDHSIVIGNPATVHFKENATEGYVNFIV